MKKQQQLGMNPGTAAHRLIKDLLFSFVVSAGHKCHHCKEELTRETFSVEHKEPWLDAANPSERFFDLKNIAFSHQSCNSAAARRPHRLYENKATSQMEYRKRRQLREPDWKWY